MQYNLAEKHIFIQDIRNYTYEEKNNLAVSMFNDKVVSFYGEDFWDFSHKVRRNKGNVQKRIIFNDKKFSDGSLINENEFYIEILKDAIYQLVISGTKTTTLYSNFNQFIKFLDYCYTFHPYKKISELSEFDFDDFVLHLKKEGFDKKPISLSKILGCVKKIVFNPNANFNYTIDFEPFLDLKLRANRKTFKNIVSQTEIIPDDKWKEIINLCILKIEEYNFNIKTENRLFHILKDSYLNDARHRYNLFFKKKLNSKKPQYKNAKAYNEYIEDLQKACGIIIQAFTGLRVSELQSLQVGCSYSKKVDIEGTKYKTKHIKGLTFKYQEKGSLNEEEGKEVSWLAPNIVIDAIQVLEKINKGIAFRLDYKIEELKCTNNNCLDLIKNKNNLFLSNKIPVKKSSISEEYISQKINFSNENYNDFIVKNNILLDFKLTPHCFRRTFARFLSRSLIDIEIEAIKEQFKHFSKEVTLYYMKEDLKGESNFAELIEEYNNYKNKNDTKNEKLVYEKMREGIDTAILTANNTEELLMLANGKQIKVINEFMATINNDNKIFSPIDCLSCEGNVIIPDIHLKYWLDMLETYNEMLLIEPNSFWYKKEKDMVQKVVNSLKQNEIYITKGKEQ